MYTLIIVSCFISDSLGKGASPIIPSCDGWTWSNVTPS